MRRKNKEGSDGKRYTFWGKNLLRKAALTGVLVRGRRKRAGRMEKMASGKLVKISETQNTKDTVEGEERRLNGRTAWGGT